MRVREHEHSLVSLAEITEIELLMLKRVREVTMGEHRSVFHGSGFEFTGLRTWEAGDRLSQVNWPQSTITNFDPLVVSEFEQPATASVIALADRSASRRCGLDGTPIAAAIARAIATFGMSAVFFQDAFGLLTFDSGFGHLGALRPRVGKGQVIHSLDCYATGEGLADIRPGDSLSMTVSSAIRRTSLVPVISDFLFDAAGDTLAELALLANTHDVIVVLVDAAFAFALPPVSAGWVEAFDVETGRSRLMSRRGFAESADRVRAWQDQVERQARSLGLDVLRLAGDDDRTAAALSEFVVLRRLRKN